MSRSWSSISVSSCAVRLSITEAEYAERFGYKKVLGSEKLLVMLER